MTMNMNNEHTSAVFRLTRDFAYKPNIKKIFALDSIFAEICGKVNETFSFSKFGFEYYL